MYEGAFEVNFVFALLDVASHELIRGMLTCLICCRRFEPSSKDGKNPITAVAFAEDLIGGKEGKQCHAILSVGTESGRIEIWAIPTHRIQCQSAVRNKSSASA